MNAFSTTIEQAAESLAGPWRMPRQMLNNQQYDGHVSIHDGAMAQKLGFKGSTIEGPTHFSQFVPLCVELSGAKWLEHGCLSAHYHRNACYKGEQSPFGRAVMPVEMISVLCGYQKDTEPFPVQGPVVGLFADQEIRLVKGPLLVGEPYEIDREVVFLSGSKRTESMWVRTRIFRPSSDDVLAMMLLNSASLKESYARHAVEVESLWTRDA